MRTRHMDRTTTVSGARKSGIWRTRTKFSLLPSPGCGSVRSAATKGAQRPRITAWIAPAATIPASLGLDSSGNLKTWNCGGADRNKSHEVIVYARINGRSTCECHRCAREKFEASGKIEVGADFFAERCKMILCPICGNKRCPHVSDHRLSCTASNEPG